MYVKVCETQGAIMSEKNSKKPITITIDTEVLRQLEQLCEEDKRTKSSAVELALEKYLKDRKQQTR